MPAPDFDGDTYEPALDGARLSSSLERVRRFFFDHPNRWFTLDQIAAGAGLDPKAAIDARIRDLRKEKFGGLDIPRRRTADPAIHEWRYVPATTTEAAAVEDDGESLDWLY